MFIVLKVQSDGTRSAVPVEKVSNYNFVTVMFLWESKAISGSVNGDYICQVIEHLSFPFSQGYRHGSLNAPCILLYFGTKYEVCE